MFISNKYSRWYFDIIKNAKQPVGVYRETHHIIPVCMGGNNSSENLVSLTAREHFICHLLLIRMVSKEHKHKLVYAAWQQSRSAKYRTRITSRQYQTLRQQLSESYTGRKRKPFTEETKHNMSLSKMGMRNYMFGKNHTEDTKKVISEKKKGNLCGIKNPFFGRTHGKEMIDNIAKKSSLKQKGVPKPKQSCPFCGGMFAANMMKRYHGRMCKQNPHFVNM